ncbi:hypothetical protein HBI23_141230 [Parastagonospora nodorum]|nr:hypothetical protein HBI79_126720 [Parastagonospora nodorum]KAH5247600.1 hypothetical protein HBI71_175200 [Parastagonospora nodorum]KAH5415578.1 hypothetical protein HBI47_147730 [Parastagonospora nodorum]KAH5657923.1 hypothetical protein HBI23_141230 [Parastagonospora nodorum]
MSNPDEHSLDPLNSSCCICFDAYGTGGMHPRAEAPIQLACGHIFGDKCLSKWISTKSTCPLCRSNVQLAPKNQPHSVPGQSFSHEDLSPFHDVEYDTNTDGESEAEDEFFDAQEQIVSSERGSSLLDEDLWLAAAAYEENASFFARVKPGFEHFTESVTPVRDKFFDELVDCHEQWMTDSMYDDESEGEFSISYYDVFPY